MDASDGQLYDEVGRTLWDTGTLLIADDKQDIGYTTYRGRNGHVYHGEVRPDHPSPFHHYQAGIICCLAGQLCGFVATMKNFQEAAKAAGEANPVTKPFTWRPLIPLKQ